MGGLLPPGEPLPALAVDDEFAGGSAFIATSVFSCVAKIELLAL